MRAALIAAAVLCVLAPPAALAANGPMSGVHVDPGSPAGKEYSAPITVARGETSGRPSGSDATNPPSFGVGVTPVTTPARATPPSTSPARGGQAAKSGTAADLRRAQRRRRGHRHSTARARASARTRAGTTAPAGASARTPAAHRSSVASVNTSSWLSLVAGGALVLLLGGGGGLALRRRMSDDR